MAAYDVKLEERPLDSDIVLYNIYIYIYIYIMLLGRFTNYFTVMC